MLCITLFLAPELGVGGHSIKLKTVEDPQEWSGRSHPFSNQIHYGSTHPLKMSNTWIFIKSHCRPLEISEVLDRIECPSLTDGRPPNLEYPNLAYSRVCDPISHHDLNQASLTPKLINS